ncbi:MAG: TonB-dependent receptor [Ignavibacteria bacterium]|jgi:iron complex outermembrane receptor protein
MKIKLQVIFMLVNSYLFCQTPSIVDSVSLSEVVVTGTKIGIARNQVPFTVSQIPQKTIEQSGESALLNVISQYTPGVFVTQRGVTGYGVSTGAAGQINMRGIGGSPNTQVLVLVNGNPQFAGIFGHPLPDTYLSSDVEKVEIIRGPASVLYGSNAMGGVVNIITKQQKTDEFQLNSRALYGSYSTAKLMLNSGFKKDKLGFFASVNHDRTDGHRPSSDFEITNGYLETGYDINNHFNLKADFSVSQTNATDPGEKSEHTPGEKIDILRTNSNITLNNEFENISGAIHLFYNYGEHDITDGFYSIDRNYGLGVYQSIKLFEGNVLTVGFNFKNYGGIARNKLAMNGAGIVFADTTVNEKAGYVLIQQTIGNYLALNAGYRLEHHNVYEYESVPSAGFAYFISNNTTIKGSVSKGFRSPTIRELYLFTPANDELEPERVINYEIGIMQKLFPGKLGVEFTAFKSDGDNLIQTLVIGGKPTNVNTGEFSNWGLELSSKYNMSSSVRYIINYTFIHQDEQMLATPEHSTYIGTNFSVDKFNINLGLQNIINLITLTNPQVTKESYTLLNANISYKINSNFDVFIKGENLLDESYQINYDYPMPGITFFGGLNFHL